MHLIFPEIDFTSKDKEEMTITMEEDSEPHLAVVFEPSDYSP